MEYCEAISSTHLFASFISYRLYKKCVMKMGEILQFHKFFYYISDFDHIFTFLHEKFCFIF